MKKKEYFSQNYKAYIFSILLSLICVFGLYIGIDIKYYLLFAAIFFVVLFSANYEIVQILLIISIFVYLKILYVQLSVWIAAFIFVSFVITYLPDTKSKMKNPLNLPTILLLFAFGLSLINSYKPLLSLYYMSNFFGLLLVFYTTAYWITNSENISKIINIYLGILFITSIYLLSLELLTEQRVFGFTQVMYVDLAGVGILISLVYFIFEHSVKKWIYGVASSLISLSLILTQTRNAWISVIVSIFVLGIYLYFNNNSFNISRKRIVTYLVVILFLFMLFYIGANYLNPEVEKRVVSATNNKISANNPASLVGKSLITRLLIWHTAILAFLKHPIIGIGAYSFPFSSQMYYKMPKVFYELFVKGLNPHQGYLGMLTETGIFGLFAFLFFLKTGLTIAIKNINLVKRRNDFKISLSIFIALVYISISFIFTQEWIYGQMAILFGLILGLIVANYNLLSIENKDEL